jgi:hypothetical protein
LTPGQLSEVFRALSVVFKIFTGELDSYEVGKAIGTFIYWLCHIGLTIYLFTIGRRWTKKQNKLIE